MIDWEELVELEPRLNDIVKATYADFDADPLAAAEIVYTQAKPSIISLIGWYRGKPQRLRQETGPALTALHATLTPFKADEDSLRSSQAYEGAVFGVWSHLVRREERRDAGLPLDWECQQTHKMRCPSPDVAAALYCQMLSDGWKKVSVSEETITFTCSCRRAFNFVDYAYRDEWIDEGACRDLMRVLDPVPCEWCARLAK